MMEKCKKCGAEVTDKELENAKQTGEWGDEEGSPAHENCGCNEWSGQEGAEDPRCVCDFK